MGVSLTGLRCLVEIVDARLNIGAASQAMHLSQPCVSRHLKQVEDALGFRVFGRRGRSLAEVTPAGMHAVEVARRVIREVDGLRSFAANTRGELAGELAVAAPQMYARHVLPPLLARLRERYPGLSISVRSLGEGEPVRPAEHSRCHLVVASTAGEDVPEGIAVPLFHWQRVLIVGHGHPLALDTGTVALAQLAAWPLVTYEASRRPQSSLNRVLAAAGLQPQFSCSAHDADTIKAYTRAGLGLGLVASLSLTPEDREHFVVRPVDPALPVCTAWAVLPEGQVLRDPTRDLVRLLAPQVDADELRRASEGMPPERWPEPPLLR